MPIVRIPIDLLYPAAGGPGVNVWHAQVPAPANDANIQGVLDIIEDFYTALLPQIPQGTRVQFNGVVTDVQSSEQEVFPTWDLGGAGGTSFAPLATAVCVSWRTGTAHRSGVGRTFISPLRTGLIDTDGTPQAAGLLAIRTAVTNLVLANGTFAGATQNGLVVYSRASGAARLITSGRVRDQFAVLRSRRD